MHDEIAGCQRAHRDGRGSQGIVHTCGDDPQALGELCIVGVGQHGPHQRGQTQTPLRLPTRNADSVARALFERQVKLGEFLLYQTHVIGQSSRRNIEQIRILLNRHPLGPHEKVVKKEGHTAVARIRNARMGQSRTV